MATRREFLKRSAGVAAAVVVAPEVLVAAAEALPVAPSPATALGGVWCSSIQLRELHAVSLVIPGAARLWVFSKGPPKICSDPEG